MNELETVTELTGRVHEDVEVGTWEKRESKKLREEQEEEEQRKDVVGGRAKLNAAVGRGTSYTAKMRGTP